MLAQSPRPLSPAQQGIYDFVKDRIEQTGISPTLREIVTGVGLSSNSVAVYNLDRLEGKGLIRRRRHLARGITLPEPTDWRQRRDLAIVAIGEVAFAVHVDHHDLKYRWQECPQRTCQRSRDAIAALGGTTP